jgi:redox-sensitive bicupin YhaK (pirin superfamily)
VFEGDHLSVADDGLDGGNGALIDAQRELALAAGPAGVECLVLQGRPIGEPVARYGPFVMNDRAGIEQTLLDYQETGFGGWPWDRSDPTHPGGAERFAVHPDGRTETPV